MSVIKSFKQFKLYNKKPNTISKGHLYIGEVFINVKNKFKNRLIRIYLPSDYEFDNANKRFPVIYMMDGKNLFDEYTSFVGEWCCDETIEERIKQHKKSFIVVGIDSAPTDIDRCQEMIPDNNDALYIDKRIKDGYASILGDFIVNKLKPLVDELFYTLSDRDNTAIGGSSMGGLFSYYVGMKYKDIFGFSLCFSPGFLIYKSSYFKNELSKYSLNNNEYGKFYFFVGGVEFEHSFINLTHFVFNYMSRFNFNSNQIKLVYDSSCKHHESSWAKYYGDAISFWLD